MSRLLTVIALLLAPAALAKAPDPCKVQCSSFKDQCAKQCDGAKKKKTECIEQMCNAAIIHCESSCRSNHAKKH